MNTGSYTKVGEIRISLWWVNVIGFIIAIPVALFFMVAETALHGPDSPTVWHLLYFCVTFSIQLVVHELLHAVGYIRFGGLYWNELKFGFSWRALAVFCNCLSPVRIDHFRRAAVLPVLVLLPISVAVWLIFGHSWLAFFAAVTLLGGIGDAIMLLKTLRYPSNLFILEHPSGIGGDLYVLTNEIQSQVGPRREEGNRA